MIPGVPRGRTGGGLIGALGRLFQQQKQAETDKAGGEAQPQPGQGSPVPAFNDPIVASLNQELAQEQRQPVPSEADQLKREQHQAWANYDFERGIVIFNRLHELEPHNPEWPGKLKVSYFNRGKPYEQQGNIQRATQCYYAALSLDPEFPEAKQAAEALLQQQGEPAAT